MDRLILLRHGDAERQAPSGEDFDRRLTATGRRESVETGESLAHLGFAPDLAIVSGAARARETYQAASDVLPPRNAPTGFAANTRSTTSVAVGQGFPWKSTIATVTAGRVEPAAVVCGCCRTGHDD